jgi:hypothetical protein
MRNVLASFVIPAALAASACGDDHDHDAAGEDPAEHACEHAGHAGTAITAAATAAEAPLISVGEEPYTVTLVEGAESFVAIQAPLEALLFAAPASIVTGLYEGESGTNDLLAQPAPNEFCASDIPEHWDLDLEGNSKYVLRLAPAAVPSVWLLLQAATGHSH